MSAISGAVGAVLLLAISSHAAPDMPADTKVLDARIPVTSHRSDVGDDPENLYSGAPQFDWNFFGNQTRMITKYSNDYLAHRHALGVDYKFYLFEDHFFSSPSGEARNKVITDYPVIPIIQFAGIGKTIYTAENGERPHGQNLEEIKAYMKPYPNLIFGGGQAAEIDVIFEWTYPQNYGRTPVGPGGKAFPTAYLDFFESNLKRSSVPYMLQEHNTFYGISYVAAERAMSLSINQLFYRAHESPCLNLVAGRSASRQYPHPFGVQFSGQVSMDLSNADAVLTDKAAPIYAMRPCTLRNYAKSYALCRQMLYLSWLNEARFFRWEAGEFTRTKGVPTPLGIFTAKAAENISKFGNVGPVQTPIAIVREFTNVWSKPEIIYHGPINFTIAGGSPYATGDYQMHGLVDFFYPHYLQTEWVYDRDMREDFALSPTPYGNSVDLLLSDVRKEALTRYGLLIWGGVPPESPSSVREKLLSHVKTNRGRVVVFGAAARSMFPELFADQAPTAVTPGATVTYGNRTFTESSDFLLESLREGLNTNKLALKVLASVGDKPLIIECFGGMVLVLSDYGVNHTESVSPKDARWSPNQLVTDIPHQLLAHAKLLLADEAARQTLFSVENKNLHYIVTRPKPGEYILGLFNDKLTSEPFKINSGIGQITSIEEVKFDDGKELLKSAAGGAAYAPTGLRGENVTYVDPKYAGMTADAPTSLRDSPKLPLDYGLSDGQHIEGRDFRLFRINVKESGVVDIPDIKYASRPSNRVVAVAGLEDIRHYLQGMPSFFQWFDGVKVDADVFLSLDDNWVAEQAHWLDRRGVRIVVDGSGIDKETAASVIAKLSLLKRAPKDLIIASPPQNVVTAAAQAEVRLLAPSAVNKLFQKGQTFKEEAALNLVALQYKNEEDLYYDLRHFAFRMDIPALRGESGATGFAGSLSPCEELSGDVVSAEPNLVSLNRLIAENRTELGKFKVIKIDSTYLLSKTDVALTEDAAALAGLNLKIVVDVRPDQMHFDRIAFYPHIPNYDSGMKLYQEIIKKMATIGAKDLIIRLADVCEMGTKEKYIQQRDETWNTFATLAEQQNINLHLTFDRDLRFSTVANFSRPNVFVLKGSKGTPSSYMGRTPKTTP